MKLKEYLKNIQDFIKKNPKSADYEVIMSSDDEGNSFQKVIYGPSLMQVDSLEDYYLEISEDNTNPNTVCIN